MTCRLVDKLCALGYKHTLELEFRLGSVSLDPNLNFRGFLPKFRKKGRVRVYGASSGKVLELPVRSFQAHIAL